MNILSKLFGKKSDENFFSHFKTDIHSHLLPNIDDGSVGVENTIDMILEYIKLGYSKAITTPHIMGDFYKNTPEIILAKLELINEQLSSRSIDFSLSAAAEYYLDESFMEKINNNEKLLTFGNNYILFETSFMNQTNFLGECIFKLKARGLKPILAHPERYNYMAQDFSKYEEIYERGVLFQINLNSLVGYYSPIAQKIAEKLIDNKMVDLVGTDCHSLKHLVATQKAFSTKYYKKLLDLNILNDKI